VITDSDSIRQLVKFAGWSVPGELRMFPNREREEAEAWASEGLAAQPADIKETPREGGKDVHTNV
jgi:hypothetical protein